MLLSWTLDSIGPMARSGRGLRAAAQCAGRARSRDPTTLGQPLRISPPATKGGSIEGMRIAVPDSKQLPVFMHHDVVRPGRRRHAHSRASAPPSRRFGCPAFFEMAQAPASSRVGDVLAASRLDRGREQAIARGCAAVRCSAELLTGAYAEELRRMGSVAPSQRMDAALRRAAGPTVAVPADPVSEVEETSPIPGYLTRPGNYLGLMWPLPALGLLRRPAARHPDRRQPYRERDVLRLGKAFQDATDFHRLGPDLASSASSAAAMPCGDSLDDRGVERFVLVIADRVVGLGAGLHLADDVLRSPSRIQGGIELAAPCWRQRNAETGQITMR